MGDLIERNKLLDSLPKNNTVLSLDVRRIVVDAPAVDAAPVVHGRWITRKGKWFSYFQCSVCGEKISYPTADGKALTNYCPNCGAKMDGEGKSK